MSLLRILLTAVWLSHAVFGFILAPTTRTNIHSLSSFISRHRDEFPSSPVSTSLTLALEGESHTSLVSENGSVLDQVLHNPTFWSFNVMLVIVFLLYSWESFVEYAKEECPPAIVPVIEKILGEMGGLGFIGLLLSALLNQAAFGEVVGNISERFLGEPSTLLESFEFLHEVFFQAAIAFFATSAFIIVRVLMSFKAILELSSEQSENFGGSDAASQELSCTVARILNAPTLEKATLIRNCDEQEGLECEVDLEDGFVRKLAVQQVNPLWRELTLTPRARASEILVLRERLKKEFNLDEDFEIRKYLEQGFATCNLDLVEISPLSWVPLIPLIALANSVDLSHDVVNPAAGNSVETSGFFLSTPLFFFPKLLIELLNIGWFAINFVKMTSIKNMLLPTVVRVEGEEGRGRLLPPAVEFDDQRKAFQANSSPFWISWIEKIYATPATNRLEELFGIAGGSGLSFYLNSIKFQTWLVVASLVVFTSNILPRDVYALTHLDSVQVGSPENLVPEVLVFGLFALINVTQIFVVPITVLNFCLISCVESFVDTEAQEDIPNA
ncbi:unnamed protein product [Cylindrotheca closterium]|uniref:Uncharacterized protein n=1 Tax=Cylindrotheca closterium TaxID=2856 RepID=A0AAD2FSJ5_9STRA|nr:unnamed protein product [Cylindrotheca closterium]